MHTVEHMSDSYFASDIFARTDFDSWSGAGSKTAFDRACERVESITGDYKKMEPVVSSGDFEELTRIKNEAEKEILSKNI